MVADSGDELEVRTTLPWDGHHSGYCLVGDATVATVDTASIELTIPAGTCLGPNVLSPPTRYDNGFDAYPETWDREWPADEELSGTPVVGIDGCTSLDGIRLIWPEGTELGRDGSVEHAAPWSIRPGDAVTLGVARVPTAELPSGLWCAPTADVALVVEVTEIRWGSGGEVPPSTSASRRFGADQDHDTGTIRSARPSRRSGGWGSGG